MKFNKYMIENQVLIPKDFEKLRVKIGRAMKIPKSSITRRTLQRDLKTMIDKKILKKKGATNQQFYALRNNL